MLDGKAYALPAPSLNTLAAAVDSTAAHQMMSLREPGTAPPHSADPQPENGVASCVSAAKVSAGATRLSEFQHEVGTTEHSTESGTRDATAAGAAGAVGQQPMSPASSPASLESSQPCTAPAAADAMAGDLAWPQQAGTSQAQEPVLAAGDLPLAGQATVSCVPAVERERPCPVCLGILQVRMQAHRCTWHPL